MKTAEQATIEDVLLVSELYFAAEEEEEEEESDELNANDGVYIGSDDDSDPDSIQEDDDEIVVSIGEETPPQEEDNHADTSWVKELRKTQKELRRENRELKEKLSRAAPQDKPADIGNKPTLDACGWDEDKFEQELTAWHERKREAESRIAKQKADQEAQENAFRAKVDQYEQEKGKLKVKDFDEAEEVVKSTLSVTQQGILVKGAKDPALLVYAIGKNPKEAARLAAITDPVEYAFAVAEVQLKMKVTNRKAPPVPERTIKGSGSISGAVDSVLERLRAEAEKSGDYSKVREYRQSKRGK
jgi:hypothetical protein